SFPSSLDIERTLGVSRKKFRAISGYCEGPPAGLQTGNDPKPNRRYHFSIATLLFPYELPIAGLRLIQCFPYPKRLIRLPGPPPVSAHRIPNPTINSTKGGRHGRKCLQNHRVGGHEPDILGRGGEKRG